ncbi:MAG: hypothetical protein K0S46_1806 [Moraxellaceae bacterium]|jgi:hypothetical protein|nr:hypothetical protein [Moraxellaceae bacterium]
MKKPALAGYCGWRAQPIQATRKGATPSLQVGHRPQGQAPMFQGRRPPLAVVGPSLLTAPDRLGEVAGGPAIKGATP